MTVSTQALGPVGLEQRPNVQKVNDPEGRHKDCRYFALDPQHDPRAVVLLEHYSVVARLDGELQLALDLLDWIGVKHCRVCGCTDQFGCERACTWSEVDLCSECKPREIHAFVISDQTDERDQTARAIHRRDVEGIVTHLHHHGHGAACTGRCTTFAPETKP